MAIEKIMTTSDSESTSMIIQIIMCMFAVCVYAIGFVLHSKVILASKRDKDMTWKLDIVNSVMMIIHYAHVIIMYGITFLVRTGSRIRIK